MPQTGVATSRDEPDLGYRGGRVSKNGRAALLAFERATAEQPAAERRGPEVHLAAELQLAPEPRVARESRVAPELRASSQSRVQGGAHAQPRDAAVPGRRTVTIRGQGAERYLQPRSRRRPERRHERDGFVADRAALWAFLLGVTLILIAVMSAH